MKKSTFWTAAVSLVIFAVVVLLTFGLYLGAAEMLDGNSYSRIAVVKNGDVGDSGDASCYFDKERGILTLKTSKVVREITLMSDGRFATTNYTDIVSGVRYVTQEAPQNEFSFAVSADFTQRHGAVCSSTKTDIGKWKLVDCKISSLSQGELQAEFIVTNDLFTVIKFYIVYPNTSIIQEWTEIRNVSGGKAVLSSPSLFEKNFGTIDGNNSDFYYMTGNGNYSGASMLKNVPLSSGYSRVFYSRDEPELQEIRGFFLDNLANDVMGVGIYNEFFAVHNRANNFGFYQLFDYIGVWSNKVNFSSDRINFDGRVAMSGKTLADGESIVTPKNLTGFWAGDMDDMGNDINEYQALYKWDYSEDYTDELHDWTSRQAQWISGRQTENAYELMQSSMRVGLSSMWIDDSWFDAASQWNETNGDDFALINEFSKKNGSRGISVWSPIWMTYYKSDVIEQHPDWLVEKGEDRGGWIGSNGGYGSHLNFARDDVYQWALDKMNSLQERWGSYMWRYDAEAVSYTDSGDNDMLAQSNNFYRFLKDFKDANPNAGIHGCSSGGHSMTIESVRYSDMQQITDGGVGDISAYYLSMLFPVCKIQGYADHDMTAWDRCLLAYTVSYNSYSAFTRISDDKQSFDQLDEIRKLNEMNSYLKSKNVKSRFSKIYRPLGTGGIGKEYFLQEMDRDCEKGAIFISYYPEQVGKTFTIYPKKLKSNFSYTVSSWEGRVKKVTKTGAELMSEGITVEGLVPGETIFMNLEDRPGNGTDTQAPSAVTSLTVKSAEYLGYAGVQLDWKKATDNIGVSYYNIYNNGILVSRVSQGTFYFGQCGNVYDNWGVSAVDGDGNESEIVTVHAIGAPSRDKFEFAADFSRTGGRGWSAYEGDENTRSRTEWNTEYGYSTGAFGNQLTANTLVLRGAKERIEWVAPRAGHISIYGKASKNRTYLFGNGVDISIAHGNNVLDSLALDGSNYTGIHADCDTYVLKDDVISVIFDPKTVSTDDKLFFDLIIEYNRIRETSAATEINIVDKEIFAEIGKTVTIPVSVKPTTAVSDLLYTVTSGENYISVDARGKISALAVGRATVKVSSASNEKLFVTVAVNIYDGKRTFDSERDFGTIQGYKNWKYVSFPNGQPEKTVPLVWSDAQSTWLGPEAYTVVTAGSFHPGNNNNVGIMFVSPYDGIVKIDLSAKLIVADNGTCVTAYLNGGELHSIQLNDSAERQSELNVKLSEGDELLFAVDAVDGNNRNDTTLMSATITFDGSVNVGECIDSFDIILSNGTRYLEVGEKAELSAVMSPLPVPVEWNITSGGDRVIFDREKLEITGLSPGVVTVQVMAKDAGTAIGTVSVTVFGATECDKFSSVYGYSSEQGKNGWRYYSYTASGGYVPLTLASDKVWRAYNWLHVSELVMHPDGGHDAVRAYEFPCDGTFRLLGKVRKANTGVGGNGVIAKIYLDSECLYNRKIGGSDVYGVTYDITVSVKKGDVLYLHVDSDGNDSFDGTEWIHNGRYIETNAVSERVRRFNDKVEELAPPTELDLSQADTVRGLFDMYETFTEDEKIQASGYGKLYVSRELLNTRAAIASKARSVERLIEIYVSTCDDTIAEYVKCVYAALSEIERAQVKNYSSFVRGDSEYNAAKRASLAENMIASLDFDGITLADERTVEFITEYINELTEEELALVSQETKDVLYAIKSKLDALRNAQSVWKLKTLIASISEICPNKEIIFEAIVLRDAMTDAQLDAVGDSALEKLARLENIL